MGEVIGVAQKFMIFLNAQWSIVANLFQACASIDELQAKAGTHNPELFKAHAEIDEVIALTISTFNEIISKIGEYRDLSEDAFAFLSDDLERAVGLSKQIAETMKDGYSEAVAGVVTVLRSKLKEIGEKVARHLTREGAQ